MANIWLGADELDFSHGSLLPIKWIVAEVVGVFEPWQVFLLTAADFCLFTALTIIMQPRSYLHMSTTEVQSQSGSARRSATAPSRAKRCCSHGGNVPRRVRVGPLTGGLTGASFWQMQASRCAVEGSLPTLPLCWGGLLSWIIKASRGFDKRRVAPV